MPVPNIFISDTPQFQVSNPGSAVLTSVSIPSGVTLKSPAVRPTRVEYLKRVYIAGMFNKILTYLPEYGNVLVTAGITTPSAAPTLAAGAGTGLTGTYIGYFTFAHIAADGTVIHQSNPSPASATVTLTNQNRSWSSLPATSTDARVTHLRLYVSVGGAIPKFVQNVTLGTTTATEAVADATVALATALPTNSDGTLNTGARGVPPYCRFIKEYHDRAWYAGDPSFPYRVWYSELGEPESVNATSFVDTRNGETVTGLGVSNGGDQLIVFCLEKAYDIQGYTATDFNMRDVMPAVGCISHHSIVNIGEMLWWAAKDGVYAYIGSPKHMMEELRTYWRTQYETNSTLFHDCIAVEDKYWHVYKLLVPQASGTTYYVGHYLPVDPSARGGEGQPWWVFDIRTRTDQTVGTVADGDGSYTVAAGTCDGYVRQENVDTNSNDDSDTNAKKGLIRTKHFFLNDQSGPRSKGGTVKDLTLNVKSESQGFTIAGYSGGDQARDGVAAWGPHTLSAMATSGSVADTERYLKPTKLSGKGVTIELTVSSPVGFEFRGLTINDTQGPQSRGKTS